MKLHIKKSEAMELLVLVGYAWDSGVFADSGKDTDVVRRIFQNWPELLESKVGWVADLSSNLHYRR